MLLVNKLNRTTEIQNGQKAIFTTTQCVSDQLGFKAPILQLTMVSRIVNI